MSKKKHWPLSKIKWRRDCFGILHYAFCPGQEAWDREAHRDLGEYPTHGGMASHWRKKDGGLCVLVTVNEKYDDEPVELVRVICHEAYHVARLVFREMHDFDTSEETTAYVLGDVAAQLFADYSRSRSPLARRRRRRAG